MSRIVTLMGKVHYEDVIGIYHIERRGVERHVVEFGKNTQLRQHNKCIKINSLTLDTYYLQHFILTGSRTSAENPIL